MENEILACIKDENIKYLESGQISKFVFPMDREEAHKKEIVHLITRFFIISSSPKGEIRYLVQKRGENKSEYPGYFTDSSSGHVIWKRNLDFKKIEKDAIRELDEEFGIPSRDLKKTQFYKLSVETYEKEKEIGYVFFGLVEHNQTVKPNPDELDIKNSRFYTRLELENILKQEKTVNYPRKIWEKILNADINSLFESEIRTGTSHNRNIALFMGRFQPLHHGHVFILKKILNSYKKIKIGIGSSQLSNTFSDPFTSTERQEFIKAIFKRRHISLKRYEIYFIPDIFDAKKWVDHVVSIVGDFDAIFSNSDWIRELFQKEGYNVEKKITIFKKKFNATNVRSLIKKKNKSWKQIVPNEVIDLMEEFDGINRIQSLNKTHDHL
ncbi:MAG: nicotinamide-nucleotide adenylyltransferase [Promethearchaeota archaeon]|jgi:nicotinamide-nucleotide adenylyltransferase